MAEATYILSIAGLDPCGGAGLLADIKTFENIGIYGFGVCSAITFQNEDRVAGLIWIQPDDIIRQLDVLFEKYTISFIKIGIIENLPTLFLLINHILRKNPQSKIIWDTILQSSSGYVFQETVEKNILHDILINIYLITPNLPESEILFATLGITDVSSLSSAISQNAYSAFLIKGGHAEDNIIVDTLYTADNCYAIFGKKYPGYNKHGSGCILSAAITAYLASGFTLFAACKKAKEYIEQYMLSSKTRLGRHNTL